MLCNILSLWRCRAGVLSPEEAEKRVAVYDIRATVATHPQSRLHNHLPWHGVLQHTLAVPKSSLLRFHKLHQPHAVWRAQSLVVQCRKHARSGEPVQSCAGMYIEAHQNVYVVVGDLVAVDLVGKMCFLGKPFTKNFLLFRRDSEHKFCAKQPGIL